MDKGIIIYEGNKVMGLIKLDDENKIIEVVGNDELIEAWSFYKQRYVAYGDLILSIEDGLLFAIAFISDCEYRSEGFNIDLGVEVKDEIERKFKILQKKYIG